MENSPGHTAVIELLREHPEWYPVVLAACEEARTIKSDRFAGAWILSRAKKHGVHWVPNLRKLVSYGILQKEGETSRGGRRAYYSMPDIDGVGRALEEFDTSHAPITPYFGHEVTPYGVSKKKTMLVPFFINLVSCGTPSDSGDAHVDDFIEVPTELAKPGYQYFLVKADGDSMNKAGINDGDRVLVRVQDYAEVGQRVFAYTQDGPTLKEFHRQGGSVLLMPRSDNPIHRPLLFDDVYIRGVVVGTVPNSQ